MSVTKVVAVIVVTDPTATTNPAQLCPTAKKAPESGASTDRSEYFTIPVTTKETRT